MALGIITLNYEYFPEFSKGRPIFNGKIFIGVPDLDPEILANQVPVTARQEDQTDVPISQPIRTSAGGIPELNGNPVQLLVDGNYAIKVLDSNDVQVYFTVNVFNGIPIVVGDDHNLLGGRDAVGAHDKIYPRQFDTFSNLLTAAFAGNLSEVIKAETLQHTQGGFGGATYIKDGTSGTASTGDELKFFDSAGLGWTIVPVDGALYAEQFGADPTGVGDSTAAAIAVVDAARNSSICNIAAFGKGTFTTTATIQLPSGDGIIIRGVGEQTIIDPTSAGSEFDTFSAPNTVALGLILENMTIFSSPVGDSYCLNAALCRNGSIFQNLSLGRAGGTFGVNGIFLQAGFYVNFNNIQIRELSGIGFHAKSLEDSVTGINAVQASNIYINGCNQNAVLEGVDPFTNLAFTFLNCTLENSVETSLTIEAFQSVDLINCYMEGNNSTALAGEATMISMNDSTVNIFGGFYRDTPTGNAAALPFETINSAFVNISDNVSITQANKEFFHPALTYDVGLIRNVDFEPPYRDRYKDDHTLSEGRKYVASKNLTLYSEMTTIPVSSRGNISIETGVAAIDFNTAQNSEVWIFSVIFGDVGNAFERGGYIKYECAVMKFGAIFNNRNIEQFDINFLNSTHMTVDFVFAAGVMNISVTPNNNTEATAYRVVIEPVTSGRNDRLSLEAP